MKDDNIQKSEVEKSEVESLTKPRSKLLKTTPHSF